VTCLSLIVASLVGWSYARSRLFGVPFGGLTNGAGKVAFCAILAPSTTLSSVGAGGNLGSAVRPENGPWTRVLICALTAALGEERVKALLRSPQRSDYWVCWLTLDQEVGPSRADEILGKATWEAVRSHPYLVAIYWRNLIEFLVGFPPASTWFESEPATTTLFPHVPFDYVRAGYASFDQNLSLRRRSELRHDFLGGAIAECRSELADKYYGLCYTVCKGLVLLIVVATLPSVWGNQHRLFTSLCLAVICYQAFVVSVFAMAAFRYHAPVMLVEMMVAFCGVWSARTRRSMERSTNLAAKDRTRQANSLGLGSVVTHT
jgi:hypothetical protein